MTPAADPAPTVPGIVTIPSPHSLDETLRRLEARITQGGLTLFAHIDHGANAAQVGLTMPAAHVLIFGNARAGTPLMLANPLIALDLPLKVLVSQGADDRVLVSYLSPAWLAERYALPDTLIANIAGIERLVQGVMAP